LSFWDSFKALYRGAREVRHEREPFWRRTCKALFLVVLPPIILPLALMAFTLYFAHRTALYLLVWILWLSKGKDLLVVYSDSPIWYEYMATQILPRVQERAFVLNWSDRNKWPRWSFRVHVFHHFGGDRDFTPLVVFFRPFRRAKSFRFWLAFKDWKQGNREPVERLRDELFSVL
jgi:hypothetical protein